METIQRPIFPRPKPKEFFRTLNKRIKGYFKENDISEKGDIRIHIKTLVFGVMYVGPFLIMLFYDITGWLSYLLWAVMGIGMAGLGMNTMHDGNHGSYSSHKWVNRIMGNSMYILAGNTNNWKVQHNGLHHTYTNIHHHDEDMDAGDLLRFSPKQKKRWFHRYQQYYAWLLYGLLTLNWVFRSDFSQKNRYLRQGELVDGKEMNPTKEWSILIATKLFYLVIWIAVPIMFFSVPGWQSFRGFLLMHYVSGFILSVIFQLAHMVEEAHMPVPDVNGTMKNKWAVHQMYTTVNFAPHNKFLSWFCGGLNYQKEHHIFHHISHVHYPALRETVKQTAEEFGVPYFEITTFRKALISHYNFLKKMGSKPVLKIV